MLWTSIVTIVSDERRGLRVPVEGGFPVDDAGRLERLPDVVVDHLGRARVGIVDAPLGAGERLLQDVDLDAFVGKGAGLVEAEGLEVPRDHLQCGHPARLHGGDELGPGLERRLAGGPQAQAPCIGEAGDGGGAGGGDVGVIRRQSLTPEIRKTSMG